MNLKLGINFQCYHYYLVGSYLLSLLRGFFKVFQNNEGKKIQAHIYNY